jgi:hypothetical protein
MRVGKDAVECRFGIRTLNCSGTLLLFGRGKIQVEGAFLSESDAVIPVTGGSGQFADVDGQMFVRTLTDTTQRYDLFITH